MPFVHSDLVLAGRRIRQLQAAVANDEPLRKQEAIAGSLPTIADNTVLANTSGGVAEPVETGLSLLLDEVFGSTQGQILTRNGSVWTVLNPGATPGYVLTTGGAGANVSWSAPSGGGGGTSFAYQASAPVSPTPAAGDRWLDSDNGVLYTFVNDGVTSQWVEL